MHAVQAVQAGRKSKLSYPIVGNSASKCVCQVEREKFAIQELEE